MIVKMLRFGFVAPALGTTRSLHPARVLLTSSLFPIARQRKLASRSNLQVDIQWHYYTFINSNGTFYQLCPPNMVKQEEVSLKARHHKRGYTDYNNLYLE